MLRTVFFALAVASYVFADMAMETMPMGQPLDSETTTTVVTPIVPRVEEIERDRQHDLTGGNQEYRKVVKGDLEHDPKSFRSYIQDVKTEQYLSNWHDIQLFYNSSDDARFLNMVVEIVRGEGLKTEMAFDKPMSPITAVLDERQEPMDDHIDYIHHYGSLPQTYSDAGVADELSKLNGDGRPLSIVDISDVMHEAGDIVPVKVIGLLGVLNDEKTIDYQIIAISINAHFADEINNLEDLELHFPDLLSATRGFFRYYRYPEKLYEIAFEGQYKDADTALNVIKERNSQWLNLIKNSSPPIGLNTECHHPEAAFKANDEQWKSIVDSA